MHVLTFEAQSLARRCLELDRSDEDDKYASLARKAGLSRGTIENTLRARLKAKAAFVIPRLKGVLIRELEKEAAAIEHELTLLRLTSERPDSDEIFAAMESLKAVRQTLERAKG